MDNNGQYAPFGDVGEYTRLLLDAQQSSACPNYMMPAHMQSIYDPHPMQSHFAPSGSSASDEGDINDDIRADAFGIDHEDDLHQEEEDENVSNDDVDAIRAKANELIMKAASAITPIWNVTEEPNSQELDVTTRI